MKELIQPFTDYLKFEKRYSAHTIQAYGDDLIAFADFIEVQMGGMSLPQISAPIIRSWLASLKDGGLHSRSIGRKISSLRSFYKYQMRSGLVNHSPMAAISTPKSNKRLPVYVEQKDMTDLLRTMGFPDDWEGWTDRLILAIFYHTGMRLSELMNLRESQFDEGKRALKVLGKGNKERIIPISPVLVEGIKQYQQKKRAELETSDKNFLLCTSKGKKLYPKYLYRTVHKYLTQVTTIEKRSPHVLRHTFATHLMNEGAELNSVKELLGHSSLASTQVYTHNTIEKLKDIHKKAHPKA